MAIDRGLVEAHFEDLRNHLRILREAAAIGREKFLGDAYRVYAVRYLLLVSVEALGHVANHLIAESGWRTPKFLAESFQTLQRGGVLKDPDLAARLTKMVGFRDLTIHRYWEINDSIAFDILEHDLGDFEEFMRAVLTHLGPVSA